MFVAIGMAGDMSGQRVVPGLGGTIASGWSVTPDSEEPSHITIGCNSNGGRIEDMLKCLTEAAKAANLI